MCELSGSKQPGRPWTTSVVEDRRICQMVKKTHSPKQPMRFFFRAKKWNVLESIAWPHLTINPIEHAFHQPKDQTDGKWPPKRAGAEEGCISSDNISIRWHLGIFATEILNIMTFISISVHLSSYFTSPEMGAGGAVIPQQLTQYWCKKSSHLKRIALVVFQVCLLEYRTALHVGGFLLTFRLLLPGACFSQTSSSAPVEGNHFACIAEFCVLLACL